MWDPYGTHLGNLHMGLPIWDLCRTRLHSPYGSHMGRPYGTHICMFAWMMMIDDDDFIIQHFFMSHTFDKIYYISLKLLTE